MVINIDTRHLVRVYLQRVYWQPNGTAQAHKPKTVLPQAQHELFSGKSLHPYAIATMPRVLHDMSHCLIQLHIRQKFYPNLPNLPASTTLHKYLLLLSPRLICFSAVRTYFSTVVQRESHSQCWRQWKYDPCRLPHVLGSSKSFWADPSSEKTLK